MIDLLLHRVLWSVDVVDVQLSTILKVSMSSVALPGADPTALSKLQFKSMLFSCMCTPPSGDVPFSDIYDTMGISNYIVILFLPARPGPHSIMYDEPCEKLAFLWSSHLPI